MFRALLVALITLLSMLATSAEANASAAFQSRRQPSQRQHANSTPREAIGSNGRLSLGHRHDVLGRVRPAELRRERIQTPWARLAADAASRHSALGRDAARPGSLLNEQPIRSLRHCDQADPVSTHPYWRTVCASYSTTAETGI